MYGNRRCFYSTVLNNQFYSMLAVFYGMINLKTSIFSALALESTYPFHFIFAYLNLTYFDCTWNVYKGSYCVWTRCFSIIYSCITWPSTPMTASPSALCAASSIVRPVFTCTKWISRGYLRNNETEFMDYYYLILRKRWFLSYFQQAPSLDEWLIKHGYRINKRV